MNPKVMVIQKDIDKREPHDFEHFLSIAKKNKCDFVLLPEYVNKQFTFDDKNTKVFKERLQELAKKYSVYIIAAFLDRHGNNIHNCGYVISKEGEILGHQKKIALLPGPESQTVTPGTEVEVFDTEFGKIGVLVCRDFFYSNLAKKAVEKGARIIFCPMFYSYWTTEYSKFTPKTRYPIDDALKVLTLIPQARAIELEIFFITANAVGNLQEEKYCENLAGHSLIAAPLHGKLQHLPHYDEGYMIQELNFDILEDSKNSFALNVNNPKTN